MSTTATAPRRIKLGEIVTLKTGARVRVIRIKKSDVWIQDAAWPIVEGVEPWMFGFTSVPVPAFWSSLAPVVELEGAR